MAYSHPSFINIVHFYAPIIPERSMCGYTTNTKETVLR